ncbi:supporter of activation of yellow protein [Drosophila novamexicana]|uniref:supporter of activation of yellow protein n=1 Tax=Drosophila novamexicana TaxID=47314 RepID=UPI0011E5BAB3|nr:supporter of activation of yellow protein [Drosophila novamexicana]
MNDLRQQQVQVAATSSSVSLAATPLCSNSSTSSTSSSSNSSSHNNNINSNSSSASAAAATTSEAAMAATALDVNGEDNNSSSGSSGSGSGSHKLILKLSKHGSQTTESLGVNDERRVEPLRIQLPAQLPATNASQLLQGIVGQPVVVPKLTIRPLKVQQPDMATNSDASSSCSSSSCADEEQQQQHQQQQLPHIVPKLTIRAANEERVGSVVPKLIIKMPDAGGGGGGAGAGAAGGGETTKLDGGNETQLISCSLSPASAASSSSASSSSYSGGEQTPTVPKLMIKTTHAGSSCISSDDQQQQQQQQQIIPKLTIKTAGGNQELVQLQAQHTVIMTHDANNAQSIPKLTIKTKSIELEDEEQLQQQQQLQPHLKLTIKNLCSPKHKVRAVLEEKINSYSSSSSKLTLTNGGEMPAAATVAAANVAAATVAAVDSEADELRRNSDDMDIDDALSKEHDPKMFHNLPAPAHSSNGIAQQQQQQQQQQHNIVDMVDLTSSPSPGNSPAHVNSNNYAGATINRSLSTAQSQNLLLECLQMQAAAAAATTGSNISNNISNNNNNNNNSSSSNPASPNSNILLSQLTAPPKSFSNNSTAASKYPQLTERLMANGAANVAATVAAATVAVAAAQQPIIDSIEILDTPEGSPHSQTTQSAYESEETQLGNHLNHMNLNRNRNRNHKPKLIAIFRYSLWLLQLPPSKQRRLDNNENDQQTHNCSNDTPATVAAGATAAAVAGTAAVTGQQPTHRSRKQKHERILNTELEEAQQQPAAHMEHALSNGSLLLAEERLAVATAAAAAAAASVYSEQQEAHVSTPLAGTGTGTGTPLPVSTVRRRGRPKRNANELTPAPAAAAATVTETLLEADSAVQSRRVQLLRKRLAIDMVSAEQPELLATAHHAATTTELNPGGMMPRFGSNTTVESNNNGMAYALATQIDLTMCSSSSSTSNGSAAITTTTVAAAAAAAAAATVDSSICSMLPPTTILSSSDPLPDVIFQPNDFSSLTATQQLRTNNNNSNNSNNNNSQHDSQDEDNYSALENSGGNGFGSSPAAPVTPTRGRGRGRGSRGGAGGSSTSSGRNSTNNAAQPRVPRMSRGASAVAKAIAQSRPRCVGGLKHQPDPERLKGFFSPSPQVFEEDTRMSADLNNSNQSVTSMEPPLTPQKQPDFLNNEESQSSMLSGVSLLDSNQGQSVDAILGSALKRPKKKKMEICVAEDTDFKASSIAEYDWPPPKGCCPSKNRDTFMIQEQVALYLGITSFKRKYPDLPRRAVDMEERNWLQEKGLVSEKMCDLGITAVWASDILDIMYADFYDKYEEYKEYIRQKHLRDIEAKQKALGLTVGNGRGLQARDRAMLSTSKWNVYFNKTRKEERVACLDLQTFTMNLPVPRTAASSTLLHRSITNVVREAALAENMPVPPQLLAPRIYDAAYQDSDYVYPLALVPGQFTSNYRRLTPAELRAYPLNTALDKPPKQQEQLLLLEGVKAAQTKAQTAALRRSQRSRQQRNNDPAKTSNASDASGSSSSSSSEASSSESDSDADSDSSCSSSASSRSSRSSNSSTSSNNSSINSASETEQKREQDARLSSNCGVCQRTQHRNARNMPEAFIRCYSCRRRVHPSCIEMPHRMVGRVRNYNWQCADCKCCIKCGSSQQPGKMLYCEQCDRGYHIYCLGVKTVPEGRWSCERCSICMRCGATRPEGLPQASLLSPGGGVGVGVGSGGEKCVKPVKHKKVKWINEYRIDHITKLREHCAMLCVPCARAKPTKRTPPTTPNSCGVGVNVSGGSGSNSNNSCANSPTSSAAQLPLSVQANGTTDAAAAALSPRSSSCSSSNMAPPLAAEAIACGSILPPIGGKRMPQQALNRNQDMAIMQSSSSSSSSFNDASTAAAAATAIGIAPPPVVA